MAMINGSEYLAGTTWYSNIDFNIPGDVLSR
jgi:hypothetical protein